MPSSCGPVSKFSKGDKCAICGRKWEEGKRYARHHVSYLKEITVILCYTCHALTHGSAKIWKHPFSEHGKDKAPLVFARKLVRVYNKALREKK